MDRTRVPVNCKYVFSVFLFLLSVGELSKARNEEYSLDRGSSTPYRGNIVKLDHSRSRRESPGAPAAVSTNPAPRFNVTDAENFTNVFETPGRRKQPEQNLSSLTYDYHNFYNSSFIGNVDYFNEHWANITPEQATAHSALSHSYNKARIIQLSFDFPFYGHNIRNVTVATAGFIFTGEHAHNWMEATQYIAPLMADFDTTLTDDSVIKLLDDGEKFTAFWENVTLQEDIAQEFTFAVTLYKNGDIIFAYKHIPIEVQEINHVQHPVKVGISDAYLTDKIVFNVCRKTIYEYHRVSFKDHQIGSNTLLKIVPLPTCLQYKSCDSCLNHDTGFNCTWRPLIQKCSSGTDRNSGTQDCHSAALP